MFNVWGIRPYPYEIFRLEEFLADDMVAIGWTDIGNLSGLTDREQIRQVLKSSKWTYDSPNSLGQAVGNICRFKEEMKMEDYVIVPDKDTVYIGIINSDYKYINIFDNSKDGYPHQRGVTWLNDKNCIPISRLPNDVQKTLKSRLTIFNIVFKDINQIFNGYSTVLNSVS